MAGEWRKLLDEPTELSLPWVGGSVVQSTQRSWGITGKYPPEFGWYRFKIQGRSARLLAGPSDIPDPTFEGGRVQRGYLVGDRMVLDAVSANLKLDELIRQSRRVFCVPLDLDRFSRARVAILPSGDAVYLSQEWPSESDDAVRSAYQDRAQSVGHIPNVTPPLEVAFRFASFQREGHERRVREFEQARIDREEAERREEQRQKILKDLGTGAGRRELAKTDFATAARVALAMSGAELLDFRRTRNPNEIVVQYRIRNRRLECTCDNEMRIIDAGICLDDHRGTKGDTWFTLESLPTVVLEAMRNDELVVWRHAPGDGV